MVKIAHGGLSMSRQIESPRRNLKRKKGEGKEALSSPTQRNGAMCDADHDSPSERPFSADTVITLSLSAPQPRASGSAYHPDASIIIVGMAGAGKKTLGVIASLDLGRKFIDFKSFFEKSTGLSPVDYHKQNGIKSYRRKDIQISRTLLREFNQNHIISGLSEIGSNAHQTLLKQIGRTNPIIYVRRAKAELSQFVSSDEEKFDQWYKHCDTFYSSCASFEFYNISVNMKHTVGHGTASTLKLKETETDFVRFLRRLFGRPPRLLFSMDPFSPTYTYALNVRLSWLETCTDFEQLECGADAINFVVDESVEATDLCDRVAKQMAMLRRKVRAPIIFEARYSTQDPSLYWSLLRHATRCLPDMVAVDLNATTSKLKSILLPKGGIKIIGCISQAEGWQNSWNEAQWTSLLAKAHCLSCDAIRVSHTISDPAENSECFMFMHSRARLCQIPIIAYNTGKLGRTSICFNPILSPTVPSSLVSDGVTVKEAQSALYSCFILHGKKFTIFGKSVSYSLSPAMHNAAYRAMGIPHRYDFFQSDNFSDIYQLFENDNYAGIAVSLPYKTEALSLMDHVSDAARDIGAVNTITIGKANDESATQSKTILRGDNTDHVGIRECISQNLSPANLVRSNTSALIIGAGGMARAAIYACRTLEVKHFCIYNRTYENAEALSQISTWSSAEITLLRDLNQDWPSHLQQPTIIVSTIPAHAIGEVPPHELNIPQKWLQSHTGGVFIELAYKPIVTRLIKQIRSLSARGWITVDGLDVLVEQGIAQFEIFTGRPAPVHIMRRAIRQEYEGASEKELYG